ncbi:MAG: hypothetical protein AB1491_01770 [Thermodesulfobacteriota bacterium]
MPAITKPVEREIIDDFAKEIRERRMQTAKPSKTVINFRTDIRDVIERTIWRVPIDLLRYRKYNGRIASDILDYERNVGILDEKDDQAQAIIANFLAEKDREKTAVLRSSIMHAGQLQPAIITCDGFLINGNRRKMVMERLHQEYPGNENFSYMKAVILPGKDEEGGPPTLLEIEKIENRYQLQSEGKSEYYGFDRALSIKRKIELGFTLEEQLRDDPRFVEVSKSELEKAVRDYKKQYLEPLECVDRYLKQFRREGQYRTISTGMSDPEGRWQAFIDYANSYSRYFSNAKRRIELGIEEDEIGSIEEAAFNIIRLRTIPDMPKVHVIMRDLPKYCGPKEGKLRILKIAEEVEPILPRDQCLDDHGNPLTPEEVDFKWAADNKRSIIYNIKKARNVYETKKEKETPLDLLGAAYKKLTHENMDVNAIDVADYGKARKLAEDIKNRADILKSEIFLLEKNSKKLAQK